MFINRLISLSELQTYPARRIVMKTTIIVILLAMALSACAPPVTPAPTSKPILPAVAPASTATSIPPPIPTAIPPTVALPPTNTPAAPTSSTSGALVASSGWRFDPIQQQGRLSRAAPALSTGMPRPSPRQPATLSLSRTSPNTPASKLTVLLKELKADTFRREALAKADIIIVGIAHNDIAWNRNDDPCDGPSTDNIDWSKFKPTCGAAAAEIFRPKFESLFAQIVALRAGKPTIFRTFNRYNDWIGDPNDNNPNDLSLTAKNATHEVLDAWGAMICKAAQSNGFTCADIYHAFNGPDGFKPAGDLLGFDYTHPSDKGNEVIAQVLADLGYAPLVP